MSAQLFRMRKAEISVEIRVLSGRRHSSDSCVSFRLLFEEKQIKTAARLFRMQTFTDPHCNNIDEIFFYSHVLLSRHCRTPTPQVRVIGRCMINFNCSAAYLEADFATTIQESAQTHTTCAPSHGWHEHNQAMKADGRQNICSVTSSANRTADGGRPNR